MVSNISIIDVSLNQLNCERAKQYYGGYGGYVNNGNNKGTSSVASSLQMNSCSKFARVP